MDAHLRGVFANRNHQYLVFSFQYGIIILSYLFDLLSNFQFQFISFNCSARMISNKKYMEDLSLIKDLKCFWIQIILGVTCMSLAFYNRSLVEQVFIYFSKNIYKANTLNDVCISNNSKLNSKKFPFFGSFAVILAES